MATEGVTTDELLSLFREFQLNPMFFTGLARGLLLCPHNVEFKRYSLIRLLSVQMFERMSLSFKVSSESECEQLLLQFPVLTLTRPWSKHTCAKLTAAAFSQSIKRSLPFHLAEWDDRAEQLLNRKISDEEKEVIEKFFTKIIDAVARAISSCKQFDSLTHENKFNLQNLDQGMAKMCKLSYEDNDYFSPYGYESATLYYAGAQDFTHWGYESVTMKL